MRAHWIGAACIALGAALIFASVLFFDRSAAAGNPTHGQSVDHADVTTLVVGLPDGRKVVCVRTQARDSYGGGVAISCDWGHAR